MADSKAAAGADRRGRRIFIGDIQGCREELELLLLKLEFRVGIDELHPVGDFVNRGPDSAGTLRLLRELGAGGVLGNHDVHLLRVADGSRSPGRRDTLGDLLSAPDRDELLGWLAQRPFCRAWDDLILVHAGLHPAWDHPETELRGIDPLRPDPRTDFCTRVRYCDAEGRVPDRDDPPPLPPFLPWYHHRTPTAWSGRTVVFGHWARLGLFESEGLRGLDSGCVWGKALSAWVAEEDRIVSVPALRMHSRPTAPTGDLPTDSAYTPGDLR